MAALLAFVVLAAVGSLLVWLVLKSRELERRRDLARKVLARKESWNYDGQRSGRIEYRFTGGADGIDWQMWYDSDRGDKSPTPRAYWSSTNLRTRELALVILGRRRYQMESGPAGRLIIGVVSGVAQAMTGQDLRPGKSDFYESAVFCSTGHPKMRRKSFRQPTASRSHCSRTG
ncbi:MAG: hypothetical protein H6R02_863 [Burkholderiaceae bacterium]|nr:hypothetical protein [Burkholderiaceae bacterium]